MSNHAATDAKLLKCLSCGAPLAFKPGDTVVRCGYCWSRVRVGSPPPPPPPHTPPTVIIETRHGHIRPRRLRRLMESAEVVSREAGN